MTRIPSTSREVHPAGILHVMSLSQARRHKREYGAVITIEDPLMKASRRLRFWRRPHPPQIVFAFEDVDDDTLGVIVAEAHHVERAIGFARQNDAVSLMVHCHAGMSRSTAIAYAILADRMGPGNEAEAMESLLAIQPEASPNLVAVRHADVLLGRDGRLEEAMWASEATDPARQDYRLRKKEKFEKFPHLYAMKAGGFGRRP